MRDLRPVTSRGGDMIANAYTAVVGVFSDPGQAGRAAEELSRAGVCEGRIVVRSGSREDGRTVGELIRLGSPEEEARAAHAEMLAGRTLVVVQADLHRSAVVDALARCGGYEVAVPT